MQLTNANWLHWLLGVESADVPLDATWHFVLHNGPASWSVFVLLGVVLILAGLIVYLYRREGGTCPHWGKLLLAGLRLGVLLLMVAIYLDPWVYFSQRRVLDPSIVVLRDASQSMGLGEDRYLDEASAAIVASATGRDADAIREEHPTRAALVNDVLARNGQQFLRGLAAQGALRVVDFSDRPQQVPLTSVVAEPKDTAGNTKSPPSVAQNGDKDATVAAPLFVLPSLVANGPSTDLLRAIQDGLSDRLVAAIVLFTDGQPTVRDAGQDDLRRAAEQAARRNVPLLIVGVGDPARPRNIAVTDIYADPQVWQQDPFEIQATVRAQGIADESVEITLVERSLRDNGNPQGEEKVVERRIIRLGESAPQARVTFSHTCATPGRFAYTVRAALLPNESNSKDNEPDSPVEVKVLSQQARVLLVAGAPTWEFIHLLHLLTREKSVDVSSWLQSMDADREQEGKTVIRHLPRSREEIFQYDVIMLLDPNPDEFDDAWLRLLKEFVGDHAGGLLYMAGPKYSGRFLSQNRTRLIRDLLPVQLGDVGRLEVDQMLDSNTRQWKLNAVPANVDHPIMRFYPEPTRSLSRWQQLPGIYWSFPSEDKKPGARMLIERPDPGSSASRSGRPLLVSGMYGSGRSVYVGFNGTWRWRRTPNDTEFYKRFWLQTTRFLVEGRSVEGKRRVEIETERTRYTIGQRIAVTARLKTPALAPLELQRVAATLTVPGSRPEQVELKPVAGQPGTYTATIVAQHKGLHELLIEMPGEPASAPPRGVATFSVALPSVELEKPWLNKPLLVELAKASGGRYFELNELNDLVKAVPDRKQVVTAVSKPILVRDSNRMALLVGLVGLLCIEWGLRKRFKLI